MSKLTIEDKKEIYKKRKKGYTFETLKKEYHVNISILKYLVKLIDVHGFHVLKTSKTTYYSPSLKEEIINKVFIHHQSITSTAIEYGLSSNGLLCNWIRSYKQNKYVIVERQKGRPSTMTKKMMNIKNYEDMTPEEKVQYLEKKNLYLEAEVEYLKKLRAVVQARKNQLPKKK